jgi:cellulase
MWSRLGLAVALASVSAVSAHTIFQELWVNGVSQGHTVGIRVPTYDGPITDVSSNDIICNGGPNPLNKPYPTKVIDVPAGSTVITEWHHTLDGANPSDGDDPISAGHSGPVMVYLAKAPSALQTDVTGLQWFKIYEDGFDGSKWGVDRLVANKGKVSVQIPSCIPSGNYFLRAEIIALHPASSYPGAQFYMECAQINITGGGSASPPTVSFPGAYKGSDPGITINIYNPPVKSYIIPGPRPFTCSGGGSSSSSSTTTTTTTTTTTKPPTTTPTTTTTTPTTTSSTGGSTVPHYGQCGGIGWTGGTVCASPYTCVKSNDYYSQCL